MGRGDLLGQGDEEQHSPHFFQLPGEHLAAPQAGADTKRISHSEMTKGEEMEVKSLMANGADKIKAGGREMRVKCVCAGFLCVPPPPIQKEQIILN